MHVVLKGQPTRLARAQGEELETEGLSRGIPAEELVFGLEQRGASEPCQ